MSFIFSYISVTYIHCICCVVHTASSSEPTHNEEKLCNSKVKHLSINFNPSNEAQLECSLTRRPASFSDDGHVRY